MSKKMLSFIIPMIVALFNILIIFFPTEVIDAARLATSLWLNNVLPSLLPFFIGTNLLMGLGAVDFLGVLLEPIMKPLFGVPGCGGFALTMGMTSGYPMGAKITARLRENEQITKTEAQRLMSFVNNSGPLFMIGAIGIGMFTSPVAGYFILITNFISAITTGMILKYYKKEPRSKIPVKQKRILHKAVKSMEAAHQKDSRPFGKLLADSVAKSMESMLQIAGFIILFCVIIKILETLGAIGALTGLLHRLGIGNDKNIITASIYGLLEVTNGASKLSSIGLSKPVLLTCAALVSFGGLSIHAQSIAFLSKTDISSAFYIVTKIMNSIITVIIGTLIYPFFNFSLPMSQEAAPVFAVNPVSQLVVSTLIYTVALVSILITAFAVNIAYYFQTRKKRGKY